MDIKPVIKIISRLIKLSESDYAAHVFVELGFIQLRDGGRG
jgi:hypothetical protein